MAKPDDSQEGTAPGWRQRAVSRSLSAARTRAEQRVQRLMDAAFGLIDEKGTTEFTIQEVVDRSKQSLRGFYQYFDGKDELLFALLEDNLKVAANAGVHCTEYSPTHVKQTVCGYGRADKEQVQRMVRMILGVDEPIAADAADALAAAICHANERTLRSALQSAGRA